MMIKEIAIDGYPLFMGYVSDDIPFVNSNPHRDRAVVCPRCGRVHRRRTAQDTRCMNEYTYLCERCDP